MIILLSKKTLTPCQFYFSLKILSHVNMIYQSTIQSALSEIANSQKQGCQNILCLQKDRQSYKTTCDHRRTYYDAGEK